MGADIKIRKNILAAEFSMDWWGIISVGDLRGTCYSN